MEGLLAGKGRRILICPYDGLSLLQITWTRSSARHAARERHANLLRFAPQPRTGFNLKGNFWNPSQIPSNHFRFVLANFPTEPHEIPICWTTLYIQPRDAFNRFVIPRDSRCVTYFVIRARFSNETISRLASYHRKTDPFNLRHDSN